MRLRISIGVLLCLSLLIVQSSRPAAQGRGGAPGGAPAQEGRGGRGAGALERDLLYAAVPGRTNDIGFGGIGILVFDAARNFRFVKRIQTWDYTAVEQPENVKGVAVSASLGMIYISTVKRLAAWDLLTE